MTQSSIAICGVQQKGLSHETDVTKWADIQETSGKYCGPASSNATWDGITPNWDANGYRLPTEAEWECAARGGETDTDTDVWAGTTDSTKLGDYAWYKDNSSEKAHEVMKLKPNGYGLYDMSGNVCEWCWDRYGDYTAAAEANPTGAAGGSGHVFRGGGRAISEAAAARASCREKITPESRYAFIGFRLARSCSN